MPWLSFVQNFVSITVFKFRETKFPSNLCRKKIICDIGPELQLENCHILDFPLIFQIDVWLGQLSFGGGQHDFRRQAAMIFFKALRFARWLLGPFSLNGWARFPANERWHHICNTLSLADTLLSHRKKTNEDDHIAWELVHYLLQLSINIYYSENIWPRCKDKMYR